MTDLSANDALQWFRSATSKLKLRSGETRAWLAAWKTCEAHGAEPERWKEWVRRNAAKAITKAKDSPSGFFITLMEAGSERPLGTPVSSVAARYPDRTEDLAAQRADRDALPPERPSLAETIHALQAGGEVAMDKYLKPFREEEMKCHA